MGYKCGREKRNQVVWWGDVEPIVRYAQNMIGQICGEYGGRLGRLSSQVFHAAQLRAITSAWIMMRSRNSGSPSFRTAIARAWSQTGFIPGLIAPALCCALSGWTDALFLSLRKSRSRALAPISAKGP